jgi:hypothetical protein
MTTTGTLIAESLRTGTSVEGVALTMTKVARSRLGDVDAGQPLLWTFIEFEIADGDADQLAQVLERSLEPQGGWYCDFRNERETFVVFAARTFRYRRGDEVGRAAASDYGRSIGVPETQLDWPI